MCTELPDTSKYMPRLFTTTALQQAKVELTWDENDVDRKDLNDKLMSGKLNEVGDQELRKYVAYSSEEDEEDEPDDEPPKELGTKSGATAALKEGYYLRIFFIFFHFLLIFLHTLRSNC